MAAPGTVASVMASKTKTKKKHFVAQKVKLFRASDPLLSVLMWGVNHSVSGGTGGRRCRGARGRRELLRPLPGGGAEMHCGSLPPSPPHQKLRSDDGGRNASRSELPRPPAAGSGGAVRGSAPRSLPARARRSVTWPRAAVRIGAAGSGGSRSPSAAGGRGAQLVRCARPAAEPPSPDASSRRSVPELYG